jgi:cobalt/nickel transport system permease protein
MAGLVAAFIFALQMLNFPVASGTSGHLLGGALAAVLVGPWVATLCIAVVLLVQGLVFADGGLSAYGINVLLIAVIPSFVGAWVFRLAWSVLPRDKASAVAGSASAALVSVLVAAATFAVLFAVGGAVDLPFAEVLGAMVGVHVLVGLGEAAITAAVVSAVVAVRPDLVALAPGLSRTTVAVAG